MARKREQPTHLSMELYDREDGTKGIKATRPDQVVRIHDKEELEYQLKHYANPDLMSVVPDSEFARKRYVEKIRPTLRYYCKKFGVECPQWLKNDKFFTDHMSAQERQQYFGTQKLSIREFKKLKKLEGAGRKKEDRAVA